MDYEKISFTIISYAGEALSLYKEAIHYAKDNDFVSSKRCMREAAEAIHLAHVAHTSVISEETSGHTIKYSFLLTHAQDIMMNSLLFETIAEEFISLYHERTGVSYEH